MTCGTKQNLYNMCMESKSWATAIGKNKNEKLVFTQNATNIFVPQKSKNGKAYPKKKMEFYSEYLRNYCNLWFWLIYFKVLQ